MIELGKSTTIKNKTVGFEIGKNGVMIIYGAPRTGKSMNLKNIIPEIYKKTNRRILTISHSKEHHLTKYPNPFSNRTGFIPVQLNITCPKYKIEDYDRPEYWTGFRGLNFNGAIMLSKIATDYKELHDNNFKKFYQILEDLPETSDQVKKFREKYGIDFGRIHRDVKESMTRKIYGAGDIFWKQGDYYLDDIYGLLINNRSISINFNLSAGNMDALQNEAMSRMVLGKMLYSLMGKNLKALNLLLVVEEADLFAPEQSEEVMMSQKMFRHFVLKELRQGIYIIFILQDKKLLIREADNFYNLAIKPIYTAKRTFLIHDKYFETTLNKYGYFEAFEPFTPGCQYENYLADYKFGIAY